MQNATFFHFSFGNSNEQNNEKQSKDGEMDGGESEGRKQSESHEQSSGDTGANDTNEPTTQKPANEERLFPRIQIKSPSKLAQEFNEKQKQSEAAAAVATAAESTSNESNRTNNNKSSVDLNTTPLYDEPTETRSYSSKEAPSSQSFDSQQNHEPPSSTDTVAVVAEVTTENSEH